jgi:hypothetical protein
MLRHFLIPIPVVLLWQLGLALTVAAQNTATLSVTGNWTNPASWTTVPPGHFPNNGNPNPSDVWNVTVASSTLTATVDAAIHINNLAWSAGTINGPSTLELHGSSVFSGTTVKALGLGDTEFRNAGTITLSGTRLQLIAAGSGLTNQSGAFFNVTSNGVALEDNTSGTGRFINHAGAIFTKSSGTGTSSVEWIFNNAGSVHVQSGTLQFDQGGSNSGDMSGNAGTQFRFSGGVFDFGSGGTLNAFGSVQVDGGTVNLGPNTNYVLNGTGLVVDGGALSLGNGTQLTVVSASTQTAGSLGGGGNASSSLTFQGDYHWSDGDLGGAGVVTFQGSNNVFNSSNTKSVAGNAANVRNAGTITLSGTRLRSFGAGTGLTNLAGALFDITSTGDALENNGTGIFHNQAGATFRKSAGAAPSIIEWTFNNAGVVEVQAGALHFLSGGSLGGNFSVSSPTGLRFQGGTFTLQDDAVFQGAGSIVTITAMPLANDATVTMNLDVFHLNGALAQGGNAASSLTINGDYSWTAGALGGPGVVQLNGDSLLSSTSVKSLSGNAANIRNAGTMTLSGTRLQSFSPGSGLTNQSGALFDITSDGIALDNNNTGTFHNQAGATFRKSAGAGTSTIEWSFNNAGAVEITSGLAQFTGAYTQSATGSLLVDGAAVQFTGSPSLQGDIMGSGDIVASSVTHTNGAISPGTSAGTLAFSGNLTLSSTSNLNFELGTLSDLIDVSGSLTVDGTLNVAGLEGFGMGTYTLFDYGGTFTDNGLELGSLPGGSDGYELFHDEANSRLVLIVAVPEPSSLLLVGLGASVGCVAVLRRRQRKNLRVSRQK